MLWPDPQASRGRLERADSRSRLPSGNNRTLERTPSRNKVQSSNIHPGQIGDRAYDELAPLKDPDIAARPPDVRPAAGGHLPPALGLDGS